jgi:hypothetical protein
LGLTLLSWILLDFPPSELIRGWAGQANMIPLLAVIGPEHMYRKNSMIWIWGLTFVQWTVIGLCLSFVIQKYRSRKIAG